MPTKQIYLVVNYLFSTLQLNIISELCENLKIIHLYAWEYNSHALKVFLTFTDLCEGIEMFDIVEHIKR